MKIKKISISNFRKLKDISFECVDTINTIVGPNGIGKSSILDALRMTKAILLPVSDQEANTTLQGMGLFSQFGEILYENVLGDRTKEAVVDIKVEISREELQSLHTNIYAFALTRLQSQLGQNAVSRLNLINLLSSSEGKTRLANLQTDTENLLKEFERYRIAQIKLTIAKQFVSGFNGFHQELVSFLLRSPVFSDTFFTVFPADRSFPTGDIAIQLGQNEINQQVNSYSIQPNTKFARLKAAIISYLMINNNDISPIQEDFRLIFDNLLPGKELEGINLEQRTGRVSILIKEIDTGATYDIDFLSSGEKGLLLTIFLLLRTVRSGGLILIDEPELHLNPSVCQNIIPFLKLSVCKNKNAQIFLTTHSAEILASTKDDDDCRLLHLIGETTISPIYKNDNEEAQEAIKSLGITTSDLLFNKGVIYLEGTTDDDYINETLKGKVTGYKIQSLGGRTVVENEIKILQTADAKKTLKGYHIFIIDFDNKPTTLKNTDNVKIIQWDRYSYENYLLNLEYLYEIVKDLNSSKAPSNRGEFNKDIKGLALEQIPPLAISEVVKVLVPSSPSITKKETSGLNALQIAQLVSSRIEILKGDLLAFEKEKWEIEYVNKVELKIAEIKGDWEENWKNKCNGKDLLLSIANKYKISNYKEFIKKLIQSNKSNDSEEWKILISKLQPLFIKKR